VFFLPTTIPPLPEEYLLFNCGRLKEAQAINKRSFFIHRNIIPLRCLLMKICFFSLSALGDVMQALGSKQKHVPYRNSKLTWLLSDSLGGRSVKMGAQHAAISLSFCRCSLMLKFLWLFLTHCCQSENDDVPVRP
jgi:hypothetical protein